MAVSQISVIDSAQTLLPITQEICPWCEQPVPHDRFEEISSRFEARENERIAEITARLREQAAREKAEAEENFRAQIELVRAEGNLALDCLREESEVSVVAARVEGRNEAEVAAKEQLTGLERAYRESQTKLEVKVNQAEQARSDAEQLALSLNELLEQVQNDNAKTIEALRQESAAIVATAREEGKSAAEVAMQGQIAEAERLATEAIETMQIKVAEAEQAKQTIATQLEELTQRHDTIVKERVEEVREVLERDKIDAVNAEKARAFDENLKLAGKVQELQRQLDDKSAEELGEGAEIDHYEALKAEFPGDRITRVGRGESGADIVHLVVHNSIECGTIIYDSKNRNAWRSEYVAKLAQDQMAARAEHAILSTQKFPTGERQLCMRDGVIVANPARVVALVQVLRRHVVMAHTLRLSNEARTQKTAALYAFITSERCSQFFERIGTHTEDLLELQVKEQKAHTTNWKRQGELIRSVQRVSAEMSSEIDVIIGTCSVADDAYESSSGE
jgi:hypothetical protein